MQRKRAPLWLRILVYAGVVVCFFAVLNFALVNIPAGVAAGLFLIALAGVWSLEGLL